MNADVRLELHVMHGQRLVGRLGYYPEGGRWTFDYEASWRDAPGSFVLAPMFALDAPVGSFDSEAIKRFLVNLFPEGRAFEVAVEQLRISRTNSFALLVEYGRDTSGAFEFVDPNRTIPSVPKRAVRYEELSERIRTQAQDGLAVWDQKVRMSVAGFQNKLLVYTEDPLRDLHPDLPIYLVEPPLASTVILKPEPARVHLLAANEHFCMRLAQALGYPVAQVALLRVPEPVLAVQRFDRIQHDGDHVERLHVIDACQAMGYSVDYKYERYIGRHRPEYRNGMSLPKLFSLSAQSASAGIKIKLELLQWVLFQLLIGNADAHGKNFSYFVQERWLRPTPWYDLVSVAMYPQLEQEFAMGVGDAFTWEALNGYELAHFLHTCGLPTLPLVREIKRLAAALPALIQKLIAQGPYTHEEAEWVSRIGCLAMDRVAKLQELAKHVKTFKAEHF